jgi:hypothetical protein
MLHTPLNLEHKNKELPNCIRKEKLQIPPDPISHPNIRMSSSSHDLLPYLKLQPYVKPFGIPEWTQRVPWQILFKISHSGGNIPTPVKGKRYGERLIRHPACLASAGVTFNSLNSGYCSHI